MKKENFIMFVCYAHRGASEYAPENTMSSFCLGIEFGANGIETDVRRTKDGVLVLFHDKDLVRVAGQEGSVADYTYEELLNFRIRNANTGEEDIIVKFEDFLRYFGFRDLHFAIELKQDGIQEEVIELLEKYNMKDKAIITCFRIEFLRPVKELRPDWRIGLLTKEVNEEILAGLAEIGGEQICPKGSIVTPENVAEWHEMGLNVRAWGITDEAVMKHAYDCGVDGMTVNFPDLLVKYMVKKQTV